MSKQEFLESFREEKPTIEDIREYLRVSKSEVFRRAGVSNNAYLNTIYGEKPMRKETVGKILDALTGFLREREELGERERLDFEDIAGVVLVPDRRARKTEQ